MCGGPGGCGVEHYSCDSSGPYGLRDSDSIAATAKCDETLAEPMHCNKAVASCG